MSKNIDHAREEKIVTDFAATNHNFRVSLENNKKYGALTKACKTLFAEAQQQGLSDQVLGDVLSAEAEAYCFSSSACVAGFYDSWQRMCRRQAEEYGIKLSFGKKPAKKRVSCKVSRVSESTNSSSASADDLIDAIGASWPHLSHEDRRKVVEAVYALAEQEAPTQEVAAA